MSDPLADLWTTQARDARPLDTAALAAAEAAFRRRIRRRDRREYIAGALIIPIFAAIAFTVPAWSVRAGALLIIAGIAVVLANLHRRRPAAPDSALGLPGRTFLRAELVAQRDSLARVWRWYLAPLVPGLLLFMLASVWPALAAQPPARAIAGVVLTVLPIALTFGVIHWLNRAAARRIQQWIDALDRD